MVQPTSQVSAKLDDFTIGRKLGQGFSAKVKIGVAPDGTERALKIFDLNNARNDQRMLELVENEVQNT